MFKINTLTMFFSYLENESGVPIGSKIQIKIHETLQNGQYNEITPDSPYSVLDVQNTNSSRTSQASIINIIKQLA